VLLVGPLLRRGSFTPVPLRGPAPNGHPRPDGASVFDGCADPGAGLLANAVDLAGRWRLTECFGQQAGSYSRLHSASKANADGEIGVSREWTRSVLECIPTRSAGTIGNGIGNRGFDGCADPVGAGLLANAVDMAGRWRLNKCFRQQAGSYSRLHSASETNADGEIGVSRKWTRSVLGCISTRSVGTIGNGIGNRGFDGCADPVGAGLLANAVDLAGRWRLAKRFRQQAGSYSRLHSASETNADGEIGVSREWTRSVLGCISTRSVGTIKGRSSADQVQIKCRSTASRLKPVPQDTACIQWDRL
jgi:hypothetical protein